MYNSLLMNKIRRRAEKNPQGSAIEWQHQRVLFGITNEQFLNDIEEDSAFYYQKVKAEGKVAVILGANSYGWICQTFALMMSGATAALLDPSVNPDDLRKAIELVEPDLFICDAAEKELGEKIGFDHPYFYNDDGIIDAEFPAGKEIYKECCPLDGSLIFFTSGTTRRSKAVLVKLSSIEGNINAILPRFFYKTGWKAYIPLPFFHCYGFSSMMAMLIGECSIILGNDRTIKKDINTFQPEILIAVPSLLEYLLKKKLLDPSVVRNIMTAGSICSLELENKIRSIGIGIQNHYGSSELFFGIAMSSPEGPVNVLIPQNQVKITISEENEILLSSPYLFQEYYHMPNETAAVYADGIFHTGDLGCLDQEGNLYLAGRKKDHLILNNGEKIFCPDVDESLAAIPGVSEAAVILKENQLCAVICPENKDELSEIQTLVDQYNLKQPSSRKIERIIWRFTPFPRTSTGKLKRGLLY